MAEASANLNPIEIFVVRLFPAAPMADDRIAQTDRALTQDRPPAASTPSASKLCCAAEVG
jgi:hypothetical protein